MPTIAICIGGSVFSPAEPDPAFWEAVANRLVDWSGSNQLYVVTGGGAPARKAIETARKARAAEEDLDRIGIHATRLNAQSLLAVLHTHGGDAPKEVPRTVPEAVALAKRHRIVVMGGTDPGHSTDFVAAQLGVESGAARLVNATNVDGVYTADPARDPEAKQIPVLDFDGLLQIIEEREWTTAGAPGVLDGPATVLVATNGLETCVVHGKDLDALAAAVQGKPFNGTRVSGAKVVLQ